MAKLKDTSVTNLNVTEDITVKGNTVYHTGRKPTADEIGAATISLGDTQPDSGYWFKQINNSTSANSSSLNVELTPHPYSLALHPITNSSVVIMEGGNNLQAEIDELKKNSGGGGNSSELEQMNNLIANLQSQISSLNTKIQQVENKCPFPVNSLYYTDATSNPSTLWSGTSWTKVEDAYIVATGASFSTSSAATGGALSFSLSSSSIPSHNHSFSVPSLSVSGNVESTVYPPGYVMYSQGSGIVSASPSGRSVPHVYYANDYSLNDSGYDEMRMYSGSSYITITDIDWFENIAETSSFSASGSFSTTTPSYSSTTGNRGSGSAISYKPKYRTVHIWKRTA